MKQNNDPRVALDLQCLSYLLDCIRGVDEPLDHLADEKKALLRSWFYTPGTFILTETVIFEVSKIKNVSRCAFHEDFISVLFLDYPVDNLPKVQERAVHFELNHSGLNDCLILAEAEELEIDYVLTYDNKFLKRLHHASNTTKLMKSTEYWAYLGIKKGAKPVTVPHNTNPLSNQTWWRW